MPGWLAPVLLALLAASGIWLIATGGDDSTGGSDGSGAATDDATPLPGGDTDSESVAELAGLVLPDSMGGFLTARLDDGSQLDITLTMDAVDEQSFIEASELPAPVEGERYVTHSSPLWVLNPETELRGSQDTYNGLTRQVELHEENGLTRLRIVIRPAD